MAITAAQVSVDATVGGVALNTASTSGQKIVVKNSHATDAVILGPSGVTTTTGLSLAAGATVTVELGPGEVLYGIRSGSNTITTHVLRTSV